MDRLCVLILGPPGSGKNTQSELLAGEFKIPHISLGAILRNVVKEDHELAAELRGYLDSGHPIPVHHMSRFIEQRLLQSDAVRGFVGDGLVCTMDQAWSFENILREANFRLAAVFYLDVPDVEVMSRIQRRWICVKCGKLYLREPSVDNRRERCSIDGWELIRRTDDVESIVQCRLAIHRSTAAAILDFYEQRNLVYKLNGDRSATDVYHDVLKTKQIFSV